MEREARSSIPTDASARAPEGGAGLAPVQTGAHPVFAFLEPIWRLGGGEAKALERLTLTGPDPVLPGVFQVGLAATASVAAAGLAAAELWREREGRAQVVSVDTRAAVAACRSERYLRVDDGPPPDLWSPLAGFYRAAGDRFIQLHTNFPHHREGVLALLGCEGTRERVARAIAGRDAFALEDALAGAGMCAAAVRSPEEWRAHPQASAVATLPLLEVVRIGDSPPETVGRGTRPLAGVRVLDLTRVIAGPVCGRTLAEHGAAVLLVTAAHLPSMAPLVIDTGRGKRAAHLDLRRADEAERLRDLVRGADVLVQSYRPGALDALGFGVDELARRRPGLVYVTISAYGHVGPWGSRRGFDSLVQSASGIAWEEGRAAGLERPKHLPAQMLDHATGHLAAFGAMSALRRRAREGGSYVVRLSLARTGRWLDGLGRVEGPPAPDLGLADVEDLLETSETPFGRVRHVRPAVQLSETPAFWALPAVPLGTHAPRWADASGA